MSPLIGRPDRDQTTDTAPLAKAARDDVNIRSHAEDGVEEGAEVPH